MLKRLAAGWALWMAVTLPAAAVALMLADWSASTEARKITLVYVGAENCGPCDAWQRSEGTAFRNSAEFQRLTYREVKSPSLFDVLKDDYWPQDLRVYRQAISQHAGVPLWLVIADDQLVLQSSGLTQWQYAVLPKIRSLAGRKISDKILAALLIDRKAGIAH